MAVEVTRFLLKTFLTTLDEIGPKLWQPLFDEFQIIKDYIGMEDKSVKDLRLSTTTCTAIVEHLYDLNDAVSDCKDFIEEHRELTGNLFLLNAVRSVVFDNKMKQKLEFIKNNLYLEIVVPGDRHLKSPVLTIYPGDRETSFDVNASQLLNFGEQERVIKEMLGDKEYKAIGIYGTSGSGKTALIQKVLEGPQICKEFSPIIWVCLSELRSEDEDKDGSIIVKHILCELGNDVDKWVISNPSKAVLLENLKKKLISRKYLIVFDDVREIYEFYSGLAETDPVGVALSNLNRFSHALPRDRGGKIVVSSCQKKIVQSMVGSKNLIHMERTGTVFGLEEQVKQIIDALVSDNGYKGIGVCGIGGSGKTTLIQEVLKSPSIYNAFSPIVWVCLSHVNFEEDGEETGKNILKHILCKLGNDVDRNMNDLNPSKAEIIRILKESLMSEKYLIVLDDVWEENSFFAKLGHKSPPDDSDGNRQFSKALPRDSGGKIIVTSRLREVAENIVGKQNLIHMKPLDKESCRLILEAGTGFLQYGTKIESLLGESGFVAIGIYGPCNAANTALVHKVLSSKIVCGMFETIIKVCDSQISSNEENGTDIGF